MFFFLVSSIYINYIIVFIFYLPVCKEPSELGVRICKQHLLTSLLTLLVTIINSQKIELINQKNHRSSAEQKLLRWVFCYCASFKQFSENDSNYNTCSVCAYNLSLTYTTQKIYVKDCLSFSSYKALFSSTLDGVVEYYSLLENLQKFSFKVNKWV